LKFINILDVRFDDADKEISQREYSQRMQGFYTMLTSIGKVSIQDQQDKSLRDKKIKKHIQNTDT